MTSGLVIVGAGGHAREVAQVVQDTVVSGQSVWHLMGFLADPGRVPVNQGQLPAPLLGAIEMLAMLPDVQVIVAVGEPDARRQLVERIRRIRPSVRFPTLIHPRAWVAPSAQVGAGCVLMAGALVNVDAWIGPQSVLNIGSTVSHDCRLDSFVSVGPGAHLAGGVQVGSMVDIGVGAVVRPRITIANQVVIGAGAVVVADVNENSVAFGVPAKQKDRK